MTKFEIDIDDLTFTCFLSKKHRKNINVRIKPNNNIYISKPKYISLKTLKNHLVKNSEWIVNSSQAITNLANKRSTYVSDDYVVIFDKKEVYQKNIHTNAFLEAKLLSYLEKVRNQYDQILLDKNLNLPKIEIKKMRGKWGACYINRELIYININLIHYPKVCIDYVLLHEYLHFIEPNHSKDFYNLLDTYMPNYKEVVKYLKLN